LGLGDLIRRFATLAVEVVLVAEPIVVAGLVASGRTNQQAAGELFVSVKAIEYHLTNIYAKLGIRSRRDLHPALHGAATSAVDSA